MDGKLLSKIRSATELLALRDRVDARLASMFGSATEPSNGKPKRKVKRAHVLYINAVRGLPKSERVRLGKIYKTNGVTAALKAAKKAKANV